MKRIWVVFSLDEAVSGISNSGIDYDEYTFTLNRHYQDYNEYGCINYIEKTMEDYKNRGVGEKTRFVIMQVFCYEGDKLFK